MNRYILAAAFALVAQAATADEITLKAITAFAEGTTYSRPFERFIQRVNESGKGLVRINYIGGPKAMTAWLHGTVLATGISTGSFWTPAHSSAERPVTRRT